MMELETRRFYERAIPKVSDAAVRKLLGDLAEAEREHYVKAGSLEQTLVTPEVRAGEDDTQRRMFVLQIVQPGFLAGR